MITENKIKVFTDNAGGLPAKPTAILLIILVSYLMIVLNISVVITSLPNMQHDLLLSTTQLSWVQNAYALAFGGLLLLGARFGDILGTRKMFLIGLGVYSIGSLFIGLAQSFPFLIASRALEGMGAAILVPSTLSLLQSNFPEGPERTRAVAYYGAVAGMGASIGLLLGGVLTGWFSWRAGFFINVPIGIAMIAITPRFISETERQPGQFDLWGAISSSLGMTALVFGMVRAAKSGWNDYQTLASLLIGIFLIVLLIKIEVRAKQPIMPLRLFKSRQRAGAYLGRILYLGAMMGFWFFMTQYFQKVLGYTPLEAGAAFLPMTIPNFMIALIVPKLTKIFGNGWLLAIGLIFSITGMAWLSFLSAENSYLISIALPMLLIGIGQGATLSPLTIAGVSGVEKRDMGAASGMVNVAHQLGGSLGLGILVVVFAGAGSNLSDAREILAHKVGISLVAGTIMLVLALLIVFLFIIRKTTKAFVTANN